MSDASFSDARESIPIFKKITESIPEPDPAHPPFHLPDQGDRSGHNSSGPSLLREEQEGDWSLCITSRIVFLSACPVRGKSTVGVILAKTLGMQFIDTDILIQQRTKRMLQKTLDEDGADAFRRIEEEVILSLHPVHTVIAIGGSVIWSRAAMEHLKSIGVVIYLGISYEEMEKRLWNITTRGIVLLPGQTLHGMYNSRVPLYEHPPGRYPDR